ncbi:hypothetical protein [Hymenobacter glacialis]|uniref:DUF3575 domain-containing protein n=1 Tax=Hymenobacter glacialis TaxID=1908236 RepID=A0A1G1SRF5_9BACT|nr:hypothetical protein [Hymenobacter glacialis]OGX81211.1 hypothetical protein BEN48_06295 [Hymenobacter glacialis]
MKCPKFTSRLLIVFFLLTALGATISRAQAQSFADSLAAPAAQVNLYRNAVRLDVGGILLLNIGTRAFNSNAVVLLPILLAYERQVSRRFSLVAEGLVNGGEAFERKSGLSVQGRWYAPLVSIWPALLGFYGAPVLGYRSVQFNSYSYGSALRRHYIGAGALLGCQAPLGRRSRMIIDISVGVMSWQKLGKVADSFYEPTAYYENEVLTADGRLGIGFRF